MTAGSKDARRTVWTMCARDPLFYINSFVWTFHANEGIEHPFVTYPYQDQALLDLFDAFGVEDQLWEKTRDMGATWCAVTAFDWDASFHYLRSFLCVSRKEELVDDKGDPDALLQRIDFIHNRLPGWLRPRTERKHMHIGYPDQSSTIDGESTTGEVGRGGKRRAILLDEFPSVENSHLVQAATFQNTKCRLFNGTSNGEDNAFYQIKEAGHTHVVRMHWIDHPLKSKGLYYSDDGKPRSPWYDEQCRRLPHPRLIARELDINYQSSTYQYFDAVSLKRIEREHTRPPTHVGHLICDHDTLEPREFVPDENGPLSLWVSPDAQNKMPTDRNYVIGGDIASGTKDELGRGASNSVLTVGDQTTGEVVAEYVINGVQPHLFAKTAITLCKWFRGSGYDSPGALLIWEANGPGDMFRDCVIEHGYRHVWYNRDEKSIGKKVSDKPGWYSTKEARKTLLEVLREAWHSGALIERSKAALNEAQAYKWLKTNEIVHAASDNTEDPSQARHNHGDRVISRGVLWWAMRARAPAAKKSLKSAPPPGCYAWRRAEWKKTQTTGAW